MSEGRISASASLQSSVGATSAEELAEKYQKLFSEHSRIKAQHSVLKKAVKKEQSENASLQEECKIKEQELRTSLQQLDLLNFHNERLTKRIQSLQDSGNARLSPGWLLGSAKKELEKSKVTLEATNVELTRKIEENEKLHKELYEVNRLYAQHVNVLQSKISDLEKKSEELQVELTRSHLASDEALSTMRKEKREVEVELDQTRAELRITKALMEKNEQKSKEGDDVLLTELRQILLGLANEAQFGQFNALREKVDSESKEIIAASFKQLQSSIREYLNALKENSDLSESSEKVKKSCQAWQNNLQNLANKAQSKISELAVEKELLVKANSNKVSDLETEISRLKEELQKLQSHGSRSLNDEHVNTEPSVSEQNSTKLDNGFTSKLASQNDSLQKDEAKGKETISNSDDDDEDNFTFVYPAGNDKKENVSENKESTVQPVAMNGLYAKSTLVDDDTNNATSNGSSFLELERDDMSVRKEDDAKQRENLIKNHYECKLAQLKEQLQLSDSRAVRLSDALKVTKTKLSEVEKAKSQTDQEISKLHKELNQSKENSTEERKNHEKTIDTMTDFIQNLSDKNKELEQRIAGLEDGPSNLRNN